MTHTTYGLCGLTGPATKLSPEVFEYEPAGVAQIELDWALAANTLQPSNDETSNERSIVSLLFRGISEVKSAPCR